MRALFSDRERPFYGQARPLELPVLPADEAARDIESLLTADGLQAGGGVDELLDVLADMFLNSTFDPAEIEKERAVIKEELAMYLDQPQHHVQELLNATLWPDQPLGRQRTRRGPA